MKSYQHSHEDEDANASILLNKRQSYTIMFVVIQ